MDLAFFALDCWIGQSGKCLKSVSLTTSQGDKDVEGKDLSFMTLWGQQRPDRPIPS